MTRDNEQGMGDRLLSHPGRVLDIQVEQLVHRVFSKTPTMLAELAPLSDLERVVLNKRLGINGEDYRSVRRTAADLHIPKSTVFDLEKRARGKIIPRIRIEK